MKLSGGQQQKIQGAIDTAVMKVAELNAKLGDGFPSASSKGQRYEVIDNVCWTASFITGLQHLCYKVTGDQPYLDRIKKDLVSFNNRLNSGIEVDTHDLGFLFEYTAMAAYKYFGDEKAREDALRAADLLYKRYFENAGIIQAWGDLTDPMQRGRMIIDCNMNLPLLYWASQQTGDRKYHNAAYNHALKAQQYIVREDNSTYHTYYFDTETGEALKGTTHQGYRDDSCWARGQAWAIYGFALSYDYTKDPSFLETAMDTADYFIQHLPGDQVVFWDLLFTDGDDQPRDSSSAAIAACGLMELSQMIARKYPDKASRYHEAAVGMVMSLIHNYSVQDDRADGLILHSVYNYNRGNGVDECTIWGDYYYLEALLRMKGQYEPII